MGKFINKIRNLSLRTSFMLYALIFLLLAIMMIFISNLAVEAGLNHIELKYEVAYSKPVSLYSADGKFFTKVKVWNTDKSFTDLLTPLDAALYQFLAIVQTVTIPLYSIVCILLAAFLFYRNKLNKPLNLLRSASEKIIESNLDFKINYQRRDEMGQLCDSFEHMRHSLDENNREMWRSMEERRRLNAAFAHDLRTPLSVLRGYTDFLKKYLPDNQLSGEEILKTVNIIDGHIGRMEHYVKSMNVLQKLEQLTPNQEEISYEALKSSLQNTAEILKKGFYLTFTEDADPKALLYVDHEMVSQVFENLFSNALRYAASAINVDLRCTKEQLEVTVTDDGAGFSPEALQKAVRPFYREGSSESLHFGLGLNICKIICEKHGGWLYIQNARPGGGAAVTAVFSNCR